MKYGYCCFSVLSATAYPCPFSRSRFDSFACSPSTASDSSSANRLASAPRSASRGTPRYRSLSRSCSIPSICSGVNC